MTIKAKPEGRKGIYLPDKESLKAFVAALEQEQIHCFMPGGGMYLGADWSKESVLNEIDKAVRMGLCLEESGSDSMGHMLALIVEVEDGKRERLQIYDIGKITEADLEIAV